uniref:Mitochondrial carrier protein n=1 Tax=Pseudo-nitzschia australis TaxID=44445 RepID=A0A6U9X4E8_9STRA|mmetsp:Transcript_26047/g.57083  ORF Transcript_26047/g.57083 Transcript_26047/m.57083 type:complete len:469 (-) Transcript_26047:324-1730(-)
MGSRSNTNYVYQKYTMSRHPHTFRRWNLLAMVTAVSVLFSILDNNCLQHKHPQVDMNGNRSCGSTVPLFAEAVSVAFVGVSLNGDENDETDGNANANDNENGNASGNGTTILEAGRTLSRLGDSAAAAESKTDSNPTTTTTLSVGEIFRKAGRKALGGGLPGAAAGVVQVFTLMWLRTAINYQCRYGGSFLSTISILFNDGGIRRFYRGIGFALFQAPIARFVATASNDGVLALLAGLPLTKDWAPAVTTLFASLTVGAFRLLLMPIDTCKTILQVDSREGFRALVRRVRAGKIGALYQGALATAVSSTIGHYPWFVIFNALSSAEWLKNMVTSKLLRNASIGLVASVVSDTVVNVFRVIKTTKQSIGSKHDFSYSDTIRVIVAADGWKGLFGRGLRARVFANSIQSIMFTVIWRGLAERWGNNDEAETVSGSKNESESSTMIRKGVRSSKRKPTKTEQADEMVEENL